MTARSLFTLLGAASLAFLPRVALAHITVASGVASANTTQEITFGVGHGCSGVDTSAVRIEIPAGVTSVRPERSDFGTVSVETDATGAVTAAVWQKSDAELHATDIAYYKLVIRLKVPNAPFTSINFLAHQTCKAPDGTLTTVDWVGLPTDPGVVAGTVEPAPTLVIVPARQPGWNAFTVPVAADPVVYFPDALIIWKGTYAYSVNTSTASQIAATPGVTPLTALVAGDQIWVRY